MRKSGPVRPPLEQCCLRSPPPYALSCPSHPRRHASPRPCPRRGQPAPTSTGKPGASDGWLVAVQSVRKRRSGRCSLKAWCLLWKEKGRRSARKGCGTSKKKCGGAGTLTQREGSTAPLLLCTKKANIMRPRCWRIHRLLGSKNRQASLACTYMYVLTWVF